MNDPGLHEPVQSSAEDAERTLRKRLDKHPATQGEADSGSSPNAALRQELRSAAQRRNDQYFQPKRWWFTSTAFPLIAGTFGPLANLMSVCALVMSWRVRILPGGSEATGERVADPRWLIAANAVSLVFALVANLLLLFNFAHRVRYAIAQPLTIIFWYLASIILMALVIAAHKHLRLSPQASHAFSQSFYYGILSSILYFIISTLLLWNLLGAYVFKAYAPSFTSLTIPQRTLMLQTISYTLYLSLGAGVFSVLEGWDFVDSLYWADYTLLTIGLGSDFPLKTTVARGLLIPYAVGGIIMIGLVIGSVRGLFLERGKNKVQRRALVKERKKVFKSLSSGRSSSACDWEQEFALMREVEAAADRRRRYWGLGTSLLAFLIVWIGGAGVFMYAEEEWGYFDALYFSYVCLLTIGYGDLYPQSNLGKPFFVIWSLIAIPAVTILISNMGDTIVHWVEKGTLWLGRKTILPEKQEEEEEDRMLHVVEESEKLGKSLAREIARLAQDVGKNPPKRYEWNEWKRFLELLEEETEKEAEAGWRWLGDDGVLLSEATETEWVLRRMCERLEKVLVEGK